MLAASPYWLRHLNEDLELPSGRFTLGRSSACDLALDDPLVSRQHAVITIEAKRVQIEDLSSRNGLLVNGMSVMEPTSLGHADRITIGRHDLFLLEQSRLRRDEKITQADIRRAPPGLGTDETAETESEHLVDSLLDACRTAIAERTITEAEETGSRLYVALRANLMRGALRTDGHLLASVPVALGLAELTKSGMWLDRIFETFTLAQRLMPGPCIEDIVRTAANVGFSGSPPLSDYLMMLSEITLENPDRQVTHIEMLSNLASS
jgi:hypothetical protein